MENKENYNEPLYENLKLFNGLELVYRHPCLHLHSEKIKEEEHNVLWEWLNEKQRA